jgi:putative PIN family toxin of toxin-antitoxin system
MTDARELLSEDLIQQIEDCAKEQGRKPVEVLEEAVGRYMAQRRLDRLAERGERLAQRRNIKEEDIPELVQQVRRENGVRGREVIRATADANILVSALTYRRGKPFQLLQKALAGEINLAISQPIVDEAMEVLERKFGAPPDFIEEARQIVAMAARTVTPAVQLDVVNDDPDDNRVLECAVTAGSEFIVTGDKDLLRLGSYDSIRIITVSDFLAQGRSQ